MTKHVSIEDEKFKKFQEFIDDLAFDYWFPLEFYSAYRVDALNNDRIMELKSRIISLLDSMPKYSQKTDRKIKEIYLEIIRRDDTESINNIISQIAFEETIRALTPMYLNDYCKRPDSTIIRHHMFKISREKYGAIKCNLCEIKDNNENLFEIDHIIALCLGGDAFDTNNMQILCLDCHDKKTKEDIRKIKRLQETVIKWVNQ